MLGALAEEQAARLLAENAASSANSAGSERGTLIAKPRGSAGDGYCLIDKMGLAGDKLSYNAIVVSLLSHPEFGDFAPHLVYCT